MVGGIFVLCAPVFLLLPVAILWPLLHQVARVITGREEQHWLVAIFFVLLMLLAAGGIAQSYPQVLQVRAVWNDPFAVTWAYWPFMYCLIAAGTVAVGFALFLAGSVFRVTTEAIRGD